MKKLNELIKCNYDIDIEGIKTSSVNIKPGDLFICIDNKTMDRHLFIDDAINKGAKAIIVKKDIKNKSIPIIKVDNPNKVFVDIINKFYDYPCNQLNLIGITGTDGKTSVATIIYNLINNCAYIGTNGIFYGNNIIESNNTTPALDKTIPLFNDMVKNNIKTVSMEVSSEGIYYNRVDGIKFKCSILTNITKEHLNTHKTLENYINCKCQLFDNTIGPCILNKDDNNFEIVKEHCKHFFTYGKDSSNDLYFKDVKLNKDNTEFILVYENKEYKIISPLLALFNVYNLCAAILALIKLGYNINELIKNIPRIKIEGRLEKINMGQNFNIIVDYAHTPNGINELIKFVKSTNYNKLIVVFSEPGERDKSKRRLKGATVIKNCDYAIITSQDSRNEDPLKIAYDLLEDVKNYNNYEIILDRSEAIKKALTKASENDLVLIIGKGNERYQIINNKIIEFNDIDEVKKQLKTLLK